MAAERNPGLMPTKRMRSPGRTWSGRPRGGVGGRRLAVAVRREVRWERECVRAGRRGMAARLPGLRRALGLELAFDGARDHHDLEQLVGALADAGEQRVAQMALDARL